jgi:hypothetical protein
MRAEMKANLVKSTPEVLLTIKPPTFLQGLAPWHTKPPPQDAERVLFAISWLVQPLSDGHWYFSVSTIVKSVNGGWTSYASFWNRRLLELC